MEQVSGVSKQISMKETILHMVNTHQGLKGVELAVKVMSVMDPVMFSHSVFTVAVSELVRDGELIEIEYTLPQMEYRLKSFFLPKGTTLGIRMEVFKDGNISFGAIKEGDSIQGRSENRLRLDDSVTDRKDV